MLLEDYFRLVPRKEIIWANENNEAKWAECKQLVNLVIQVIGECSVFILQLFHKYEIMSKKCFKTLLFQSST